MNSTYNRTAWLLAIFCFLHSFVPLYAKSMGLVVTKSSNGNKLYFDESNYIKVNTKNGLNYKGKFTVLNNEVITVKGTPIYINEITSLSPVNVSRRFFAYTTISLAIVFTALTGYFVLVEKDFTGLLLGLFSGTAAIGFATSALGLTFTKKKYNFENGSATLEIMDLTDILEQ